MESTATLHIDRLINLLERVDYFDESIEGKKLVFDFLIFATFAIKKDKRLRDTRQDREKIYAEWEQLENTFSYQIALIDDNIIIVSVNPCPFG